MKSASLWCRSVSCLVLLIFASTTWTWGQAVGALTGIVTDVSGAVVAGAQLSITDLATAAIRTTTTGTNGVYAFPRLAPGSYRVEVTAEGFKTARRERADVVVNLPTTLDFKLEVGMVKEVVDVTGGIVAINTQDSSLGDSFAEKAILQLPLEGRNIAGLLSLQAGAVYVPTGDNRSGSMQGGRSDQSNYTLDGVSVNDPENQLAAYQTTLRVTPDSVEEFRATTSNYGAEQAGGGGAQVQLVTKRGTNVLHGSLYEYLRNTATSSDEYFTKLAGLKTPKLDKNTFGASAGGPILKNRLFVFGNYEGLRESSEAPTLRDVPSETMRDGVLIYQCASQAACPGGTVQGITQSHSIPEGFYGLTPQQNAAIDPLGIGPSLGVAQHFQLYPTPNDPGYDGVNIMGFRFSAPFKTQLNTGILRLDYKLDAAGRHNLLFRGVMQDDTLGGVPQFPGLPPDSTTRTTSKGMVLGYDAALNPHVENSLRWGFTRPQTNVSGLLKQSQISFLYMDDLPAKTSSSYEAEPTHELREDLTWSKHNHILQFGGQLMFNRIPRWSNLWSFTSASEDPYWMGGIGKTYVPGAATCTTPGCAEVPAVASGYQGVWAYSSIEIWGINSRGAGNYNYTRNGTLLPVGAPVQRRYATDNYAWYVQDQWHVKPSLSVTFGVRHNLFSPPWEVNGNQVCPTPGAGTEFNERRAGMFKGIPTSAQPLISFNLCGPGNDKPSFYSWDYTNFSPRASAAWSPRFKSGMLGQLFGDGKTSVRGGYSLVWDDIGMAIARTFDSGAAQWGPGTYGLSASLSAPFGSITESTSGARFTGINSMPGPPVIPAAPPGGFPATPPAFAVGLSSIVDNTIVTPHTHVVDLALQRELPGNFTVQAAYVGRFGRNLITKRDYAQPLDLVDPKSGMDMYTAMDLLGKLMRVGDPRGLSVGTNTHLVQPIAYWEDMYPAAAGHPIFDIYGVGAASTATQTMYDYMLGYRGDYMDALQSVDNYAGAPFYSALGPFAYSLQQFCCLTGQSTVGVSNYNALELTVRKHTSHGLRFDFNYTFSHSLDFTSDTERGNPINGGLFTGGVSTVLLDSWFPRKSYSNSDFDLRHQLNANWSYELPFGRGKWLGSTVPGWVNGIVGGWQISGLYRWSSGFPFNVLSCGSCFTTDDTLVNNAVLFNPSAPLPSTRVTKGAGSYPDAFSNASQAVLAFMPGVPGEIGLRNVFRGDGYFSIDTSVRKTFDLADEGRLRLAFAWDTFNLTNTPKFNAENMNAEIDIPATFGHYNSTMATCDGVAGRCMQFSLRLEF